MNRKSNESRLAVIEGKWFPSGPTMRNVSVKEIFDLLCDIRFEDPHSYHYEMFNNDVALKEIIERLASKDGIHCMYIASHGSQNGLTGSNEELISTTKIKNAISSTNDHKGRFHGLFFGSCHFGSKKNLEEIMNSRERLTWAAGYETKVNFIKSSALDMMFLSEYLICLDDEGKEITTPLTKIRKTSEWAKKAIPGLIRELGFNVICRNTKGELETLIDPDA